jgi:hypothetical protein
VFNLDLSTWGLTSKTREIERFRDFFDMDILRHSNALFGYEGDKYYFDIDIRKHFGLDQYNTDVIPYWKTETIEAMSAFRHRSNFTTGAGECVSLSALYAAAMFVVGRVALEKIFLIATPLHSQNFIIEKEGLITNNRRIVTKNMWFNGTSLSEKARRALENERVTIVSHVSGYIHAIYNDATINEKAYDLFSTRLREFLITDLTNNVFINFLRFKPKYRSLFQFECRCPGIRRYISLDKLFEYEHLSRYKISPESRPSLVNEIEGDEFHLSPLNGKIIFNLAEEIIEKNAGRSLDVTRDMFMDIRDTMDPGVITSMFDDLSKFIATEPRLPDKRKNFIQTPFPGLNGAESWDEAFFLISGSAGTSETALLSLYVYRDMERISWLPFIKAAVERNPVSIDGLSTKPVEEVLDILASMPSESIYDGQRLAQPDEVWNFGRGDGVEKALLLANLILHGDPSAGFSVEIDNEAVRFSIDGSEYRFNSGKRFRKVIKISGNNYMAD